MIWVHRYQLRSRSLLGARASGRARAGALVRVETREWEGFADLHPWPELGDEPLEKQLAALSSGAPFALGERTLAHAEIDGRARAESRSAFDGAHVPDSHWLCGEVAELDVAALESARATGFAAVKAKAGRDWQGEARRLARLAPEWPAGLALRLDFNSSIEAARAMRFWHALPCEMRARVEFIEDAAPWDECAWLGLARLGLPLAFDRPRGARSVSVPSWLSFVICKPALQDPDEVLRGAPQAKAAFTSYLDHPLGQCAAALAAARARSPGESIAAGLQSHFVYEPTEFSEALSAFGPRWKAPEGTGFGFDELLRRLDWRAAEAE